MIRSKTYKNGLRLAVHEMQGLYSVSMGIFVGTGSAFESLDEDGISHYIEHMQFKGTRSRTAFEISEAFERIGSQVNAFTGKDMTCYYCKSTKEHIEESFAILSDLFLNATYPDEEAKKEKEVIVEEISMNEDTPEDLCVDLLCENFYGKQGFGMNVLGSSENVRSFTKERVERYKSRRYVPENIVISMAGAISFELADAIVQRYFSMDAAPFAAQQIPVQMTKKHSFCQKPIEQVHIALGFNAPSRLSPLHFASNLFNEVFGDGMSSRLFQKLREESGLAYSVYSYPTSHNECGRLTVYAAVNVKNVNEAIRQIFACIDEVKKSGITQSELDRAKEILKAGMVFGQEATSSQMISCGKSLLFENEIPDLEKDIAAINAVTLKDIDRVIEICFGTDVYASAVVGPMKKAPAMPERI